jgi:methionyl-tRNA formyltransferase
MLSAYEVDVGLCTGFPWLVPREALETPPLGIVNGHPSLLPRYRGPFPIAWAVRNGEDEIGMSYHFMDAGFDTGNLLAQTRIPLAADDTWETVVPKLEAAAQELLPAVFHRLEAGDPGDPQPEEGEYQSEFEEDYERIDASRTAAEVHAQVRAWSFVPEFAQKGPRLGDLRVTRTSLIDVDGAERLDCADGPVWIVASEAV